MDHENKTSSENNQLVKIGPGFNLASANLYLDAQLHDGIRAHLTTYLSSRHHNDVWVKGGYLQVDKLTFLNSPVVDELMKFTTIRVGHMEINYSDAHFRRSDNAQAMYNPFTENYIMDAFTTEIGGEVYYQRNGFIAMAAVTNGEIKGDVTRPSQREPSVYGKIGFDRQVMDELRVRLTGSVYTTSGSINNTLYGGDRAGSNYYMVLENSKANPSSNFTSGRFNPGFTDKVTAFVINPFIKWQGIELFGNFEIAEGKASEELADRTWTQTGVDLVYRFGKQESFFAGARYNSVSGDLPVIEKNPTINRVQIAGGWFVTKNILAKIEYVNQQYNDFPAFDIRHEGKFSGLMVEGVISF